MSEREHCDGPPTGWRCLRAKGHPGPCAAIQEDGTDWRCECGDLNRHHEAFCYRCGAGRPEGAREEVIAQIRALAHEQDYATMCSWRALADRLAGGQSDLECRPCSASEPRA
jgi:hypothetical protein